MLELRNISKIYQTKTRRVAALDGVSFALPEKGFVFILGRSGSGKTTMLNMLGGLDAPTEGELIVDGVSSKDFKQADFDHYRNRYVGFVFQEYHLLDDYTVADNIALALELQGDLTQEERQQKIEDALAQVDLAGYGDRNTGELSGGQKQRVAIARALVKDPPMILADEPTGALDRKTGRQLFDLLKAISKKKLVVVVSHDEDFAHEYADRILELEDGKIISDTAPIESQTVQKKQTAAMPTTKLSVRIAARLGWDSLKKRKLAFSFVVVLCTAAFLFVGAADMLACYNKRTVLLKSLEMQKPKYLSVTKEYYNNYNYDEISPMLPTQEALNWYHNTLLRTTGGTAGWYNGYMLNDADIADLEARTGKVVKGVYVPPVSVMKIKDNYMEKGTAELDNIKYIKEFRGFMELDEATMDGFGFTLLEGVLPDAAKDEIVISKAVYDCFAELGYWRYGYRLSIGYSKFINGEQTYFAEDIPYYDFLEDSVAAIQAAIQRIEEKSGIRLENPHVRTEIDPGKTEIADITQMSDLIGRTVFIENRDYTITGIVDTNLSSGLTEEELAHEYQWGLAALAFVGPGKMEEIAARYYTAVTLQNCNFLVFSQVDEFSFSWNKFVRASDLNPAYCRPEDDKGKMYVSAGTSWNSSAGLSGSSNRLWDQIQKNKHQKVKYQLEVRWGNSAAFYVDTDWTLRDIHYEPAGLDLYELEIFSPSNPIDADNLEICTLNDVIVLDDYYFDLFTEGRAGRYTYAVVSGFDPADSVTAIAEGCLQEKNATRYRFEDLTAYQLEKLDEPLRAFAELFRFVSLGMVLFAMALFTIFITTGLYGKKQQIGIMRALGAGSRDIFAIFFTEGLLVAAISAVLATALTAITAIVGSALLRNLFDLRLTLLNFSVRQAVMIFALSFGIAIVASIIPILRIARQKPVDAIRKN